MYIIKFNILKKNKIKFKLKQNVRRKKIYIHH